MKLVFCSISDFGRFVVRMMLFGWLISTIIHPGTPCLARSKSVADTVDQFPDPENYEQAEALLSELFKSGDPEVVAKLASLRIPGQAGLKIFSKVLHHEASIIKLEGVYVIKSEFLDESIAILDILISEYEKDDEMVALEIASLFGMLGKRAEKAVPSIISKLENGNGNLQMQIASIRALKEMGAYAKKALPVLRAKLEASDSEIVLEAYIAVGAIRNEPPLSAMEFEKESAKGFLKGKAYRAFQSIQNGMVDRQSALKYLTHCLQRDNPSAERLMALKLMEKLGPSSSESLQAILGAYQSSDDFVVHTARTAFLALKPEDEAAISWLGQQLETGNDRIGMICALALLKYENRVALVVSNLIRSFEYFGPQTNISRIGTTLDLFRLAGASASDALPLLRGLLPEHSGIYANRSKHVANYLRAYILLTIAGIGVSEEDLPIILDLLANGQTPYEVAAATRAAAMLPAKKEKLTLYLLRPLKSDFVDQVITFDGFMKSADLKLPEFNTCAKLEVIRAIVAIGAPAARQAIPLLKQRAGDPAGMKGLPQDYRMEARLAMEKLMKSREAQ